MSQRTLTCDRCVAAGRKWTPAPAEPRTNGHGNVRVDRVFVHYIAAINVPKGAPHNRAERRRRATRQQTLRSWSRRRF